MIRYAPRSLGWWLVAAVGLVLVLLATSCKLNESEVVKLEDGSCVRFRAAGVNGCNGEPGIVPIRVICPGAVPAPLGAR